jgi:phosphomevalonate kinase
VQTGVEGRKIGLRRPLPRVVTFSVSVRSAAMLRLGPQAMERTISAPGKLFLTGEYAVLWGGTARVLAVGPRVRALVRSRVDRRVEVVLEDSRLSGTATPAGVKWDGEVPADFRFVATTLDHGYRSAGLEGPGLELAIEPSPTFQGQKLGVGGSARACVLAAEAARSALGASFDSLKLALLAHADAQRGKGSGGDVAAVFAGSVIGYRRYDTAALVKAAIRGGLASAMAAAPPVDVTRCRPPVFPMLYVFSGQSASTTDLIGQVEADWPAGERQRFVLRSDGLGQQLEGALARGPFEEVREHLGSLQELLFSLGPTRSDALERLLRLSETYGCAGKQSGAGGGDGAIVFAPDVEARDAAAKGLESRGFHALPVFLEAGLQGEASRPPELARWLEAIPR